MAKLNDLRTKLRSGELEAEKDQQQKRYVINAEGTDALLKFGRHKGLTLTQIVKVEPAYLDHIRNGDFPEELKDVVRYRHLRELSKGIQDAAEDIEKSSVEGGPRRMPMLRRATPSKKPMMKRTER